MPAPITFKDFVDKCRSVHGYRYSYLESTYIRQGLSLTIKCRKHGVFSQKGEVHLMGSGCPDCAGITMQEGVQAKQIPFKKMVELAKQLGGTLRLSEGSKYRGTATPMIFKCPTHGNVNVTGRNLFRGAPCKRCSNARSAKARSLTTGEFITRSRQAHGDTYDYSNTLVLSSTKPVNVVCLKHGVFRQTADSHMQGHGCPKCGMAGKQSFLALNWLRHEARRRGIRIRHAGNHGEFVIPNTRLHVDGYHKASNTVFEFHGDYWHGHPSQVKAKPELKELLLERRRKTKKRIKLLKSLGYNVVEMWEFDWRKECK